MKRKAIREAIAGGLAALMVMFVLGGWALFAPLLRAANSVEKLEDGLYALDFAGDDGFDRFLEQGGAASEKELAEYLVSFLSRGLYKPGGELPAGGFGCSAIYTQDANGVYFFGRNYDWAECRALIVHSKPKNGYESISTCCLDFLGFEEDFAPDGSMAERMRSLAAIYVPLDGMNSAGLVVADLMAGDEEETHQRTEKPDLTTTTAIRLLLNRAANVDEAVELLRQYDMNSSLDFAHHLALADAEGNSVVVEYVNGEMLVEEARIVTNHYLAKSEKRGVGSAQSHLRYEMLAAYNEPAGEREVRHLLQSVAQGNLPRIDGSYDKTMWSIVYCPEGRCADFYFKEKYRQSYLLTLSDGAGFLTRSDAP